LQEKRDLVGRLIDVENLCICEGYDRAFVSLRLDISNVIRIDVGINFSGQFDE
jgi:hypothetical protein